MNIKRAITSLNSPENSDSRAQESSFTPIIGKHLVIGRQVVSIEAVNDNGELRLVPRTGGEPLMIDDAGQQKVPTIDWLRAKAARGEARVQDIPNDPMTAAAFSDLLDPLAALEGKERPRALWHLANRALKAKVPKSLPQIDDWLELHFGVGPFDLDIERPSARTLVRKMNQVEAGDTIADLANRSGRKRGGTPFAPETDRLIHQAVLEYWGTPKWGKWEAYERLKGLVNVANRKLQTGAKPHKMISKSAFYKRVDALECGDTVAAKFGREEARRRFEGTGEPIEVRYCFEYGYVDATRLENVIVFDEHSRLPFLKPWVTAIMEMKSGTILAGHVHAGDPRMETTVQTLLLSLMPPELEEPVGDWAVSHDEREHSARGDAQELSVTGKNRSRAFGPCRRYIPDNAKSLFGPALAPSINEAGFDIELPPVGMPTGKAKIERFFRTLKDQLRQTPLPVVDMIRAAEMNYDVGEHAITLSQLRDLVAQVVAIHNNSPANERGKRTREQIIAQDADLVPKALMIDIDRVERAIGTTDQAILDRNGVQYDGLRYRDKEKVQSLIKNLKHLGPDRVRKRRQREVAIVVKIRRNPGDLSSFHVFDDTEKRWVSLPSTEPEYTHLLSAGEHKIFQRRAKERNEAVKNNEERLASAARTRNEMDQLVPDLKFQKRRKFAALYESKEVRERARRTYPLPAEHEAVVHLDINADARKDIGLPGDASFSFARAETNSLGRGPGEPAEDEADIDEIDFDAIDIGDDGEDF